MPQTVLYINYFRDENPLRRREYLTCLEHNLSQPWLDHVVIMLERASDLVDLPDHPRASVRDLGRRMTFRDAMDHAERWPAGTTMIVANLDIEFLTPEAWTALDRDFWQPPGPPRAMVCTRRDLTREGEWIRPEPDSTRGNFCDVWVFRLPVLAAFLAEDLDFCVGGAPQCDNVMMHLMSRHYHTYSWGDRYQVGHRDLARKDRGAGMIFTPATDWRASRRRGEHANIPTDQPWAELLAQGLPPRVVPTFADPSRPPDQQPAGAVLPPAILPGVRPRRGPSP